MVDGLTDDTVGALGATTTVVAVVGTLLHVTTTAWLVATANDGGRHVRDVEETYETEVHSVGVDPMPMVQADPKLVPVTVSTLGAVPAKVAAKVVGDTEASVGAAAV